MAASRSGNHAWMAFASICAMLIVWTGIGWNCMGLYADPVTTELGITRTQFMVTLTIMALTNAAVSLTAYGQIEARVGIRKMMLAGGALSTAAFLVWANVQSIGMLYLGGFLFGLGLSMVTSNTVATAIDHWFRKRMGTLISVGNTLSSIAGVVMTIVVAAIIAALGWRGGFLVTCIISAAATVICVLLYKGDPAELGERPLYADEVDGSGEVPVEEDGIAYAQIFKRPGFWILAITYFFSGMIAFAVYSNLALFAVDFGFSESQGVIISIALAASTITMVPFGALCDKFGTKWMMAICMACLIVVMFLFQGSEISLPLLYAAGVIAGIGYNVNLIPMGVSVKEAFGSREFSKKVGAVVGFNFVGVALGPTVLNLFYDLTGAYNTGLMAFMVVAVLVVAGCFIGTRRQEA